MKLQESLLPKVFTWLTVLLAVSFLVFLILFRDKMNNYISSEIKSLPGTQQQLSAASLIDSLYNYQENGQSFQVTFLEFGAKGCVACRKMETVMKEVKIEFPQSVQVIFLNILELENQSLMKYYGIAEIPTQVLLGSNGEEYFRHAGYISFSELRQHFKFYSE